MCCVFCCLCVCVCTCTCVDARGQSQLSFKHSPFLLRQNLIGLELTKQTRPAGHEPPSVPLSSAKFQDYKCPPPCQAFLRQGLGISLRTVSVSLTVPSPQLHFYSSFGDRVLPCSPDWARSFHVTKLAWNLDRSPSSASTVHIQEEYTWSVGLFHSFSVL